jgi:hypothetical protein
MKIVSCLLFLLILFGCATGRGPASIQDAQQHIVFDIDWTIVAETETPKLFPANRVINVDGKFYVIYEGLDSFIEKILNTPQMKVSFYSGGAKSRNDDLLKKIKLKDGRSLYSIAYKILSKEDLVEMPNVTPDQKFSERFKKDLTKVSEDLEQVLMFDDTNGFTLPGKARQQDQVFHIGMSYLPFRDYIDSSGSQGKYIPPSREAWELDRRRLSILEEAFKESYVEWQKGGNTTLARIMKRKETELRLDQHLWNEHSRRLYTKAFPVASTEGCAKLIPAFF